MSEEGPLTIELSRRLLREGWQVSVLRPEGGEALPLESAVRSFSSALDETRLRGTLERLSSDMGPIDALIYLDGECAEERPGSPTWAAHKARLRSAFLAASHFKADLTRNQPEVRKTFMTVTRQDGRFGLGAGAPQPLGAALNGLTKSLAWEWPNTFCRAVDLAFGLAPELAAARLVNELLDARRGLVQVGWSDVDRVTLEPCEEPARLEATCDIGPDDVFLVSGGARGVTASCVVELARQYRCRFVLLGRSAIGGVDPAWVGSASDLEQLQKNAAAHLVSRGEQPTPVKIQQAINPTLCKREVEALLQTLGRLGAQAEYVCVDVTDAETLRAAVQPIAAKLGPITGIVHGAGVLADKFIEKKTELDFTRVFDTKVEGLAALLSCVDLASLRHVALFSSAAGFFGNRGQTDYAMANEVLNSWSIRLQRQNPKLRVVSFNFGPWDGGMVTPSLRKLFAKNGVIAIDLRGGAELFASALSGLAGASSPHLLVGHGLLMAPTLTPLPGRTFRLSRKIDVDGTPALKDHQIAGHVVLPMVHVAAWLANSCEDVYPGYGFYRLEEFKMLKGIVLDAQLPDRFDLVLTEQNFFDGGIFIDAALSARLPNGREQPFYRARVVLRRDVPERPQLTTMNLTQDPALRSRLNPYRDGTLFHGPAFQAVQRILNISDQGLTLECRAHHVPEEQQGQFPIRVLDPYRADACFQSVLIWVRERYSAGSLPVSVEWGEMYSVPPSTEPFYVTLQVTSATPSSVKTDIFAHDENGLVFGRLVGAKVAVSKHLNRMFAEPQVPKAALGSEHRAC